MSNVSHIKQSKKSSMDWSVIETLRSLADEIESGEVNYNKCFICLLDDEADGDYGWGFRMAKMKGSEAVALLEITKSDLLNCINGLSSNIS